MLARWMVTFTALARPVPADCSRPAMFCRAVRVCTVTLPGRKAPVAGSMEIISERNSRSPARMPVLRGTRSAALTLRWVLGELKAVRNVMAIPSHGGDHVELHLEAVQDA